MQRYRPYRFCMLHATASVEIIECADDDDAKRRAREILAASSRRFADARRSGCF
jgi:hypothetical protein